MMLSTLFKTASAFFSKNRSLALKTAAPLLLATQLHAQPAQPVLNAQFTSLDNSVVQLTDYRGKVVMVNFWATWCAPCIKEMPSMERLYQSLKGEHFEMLAINSGEPAGQIQSFLPRLPSPVSFPILMDSESAAYEVFALRGMPSTYILDHQGRLIHTVVGAKEWDSDEAKAALLPLIEQAATAR